MIVVETDDRHRVAGYPSWWVVPIAEVSEVDSVKAAFPVRLRRTTARKDSFCGSTARGIPGSSRMFLSDGVIFFRM